MGQTGRKPGAPLARYPAGVGALLPLAMGGMWLWRRRAEPLVRAIGGWVLLTFVLIYLPTGLQRRLLSGLQVPLGILAGAATAWLLQRLPRARRPLAITVLLVLTVPTNVFLLRALQGAVDMGALYAFYTDDEAAALAWLEEHATQGDLLLASMDFSNFVPAHSDARVVHGHTSEVIDGARKLELAHQYFAGQRTLAELERALPGHHVTLIAVGPRERNLASAGGPELDGFDPVFVTDTVTLYAVP